MQSDEHILNIIDEVDKSKRFVTYLIDLVAIYAIFVIFFFIFQVEVLFLNLFLFVLYYFVFEANGGKTIGKYVTGTIAICDNGEPLTTIDALKRSLCRIIPFEPFSILFNDGLAWHDSIPSTAVVLESDYNDYLEGYTDEFDEDFE